MPVLLKCPSCSGSLRVEESLLGRKVRCPKCSHVWLAERPADAGATAVQPPRETNPLAPRPTPDRPRPAPRSRDDEDREDEHDEGDARPWDRPGRVRRDSEPHRGTLVMVLGIVGVSLAGLAIVSACCSPLISLIAVVALPTSLVAIIMGRRDLRLMEQGEMDADGQSSTKSGVICGIVGACLSGVGLLILLLFGVAYGLFLYFAFSVTPPVPPTPPPPIVPGPVNPPTQPLPTQPKPPPTTPANTEPGAKDYVRVVFSPDGKHLATLNANGKVRLCDLQGKELASFESPNFGTGNGLAFSPDGKRIAASGSTNKTVIFNVEARRIIRADIAGQHPQFVGDPAELVVARGPYLAFVNPDTGRSLKPLPLPGDLTTAAVTPDGKTVLVGGTDGTLKWFDADSRKEIGKSEAHKEPIVKTVLSRDGKRAATADKKGVVKFWDVEGRKEIEGSIFPFQGTVALSFSPDGSMVAIGKEVGHVPVWGIEEKNIVQNWTLPNRGKLTDVAFAAEGQTLALVGPGHLEVVSWPKANKK